MAYASIDDLAAWLPAGTTVTDPDLKLQRASEIIDSHLLGAVYDATDGLPTDATVAAAMRDAVCAQVEAWLAAGTDHTGTGLEYQSVTIGKVALSRGATGGPAGAGVTGTTLAPHAALLLSNAGLLGASPVAAWW